MAPAFHYSEAKSAESRKDFVHKFKIALKELRESSTCMKIIQRKPLLKDALLDQLLNETEELISIFVKSIQTAKKNMEHPTLK
jgi:four helix bundle protein